MPNDDPLAKRIAELEKRIKEIEKQLAICTCCECRNYEKDIPLKEEK